MKATLSSFRAMAGMPGGDEQAAAGAQHLRQGPPNALVDLAACGIGRRSRLGIWRP